MFFPGNSIADIKKHIHAELDGQYGKSEVQAFYLMLLQEYAGYSPTRVLAEPGLTLTESELLKVHFAVKDLKRWKPLQYILGKANFCGLELKVDETVLIPRPETEELVNWVLEDHGKRTGAFSIVDIGTGSACIALALSKALPDAQVMGADVSEKALALARQNNENCGTKVSFYLLDLLNEDTWPERSFDVIVSNPPYVRNSEKQFMSENVLAWEPSSALFVSDEDPLIFYRAIMTFAKQRLSPSSFLYLEINEALSQEMLALADSQGFADAAIRKDLNGKNRMLRARLSA
jgi:release factor glutamine methyltransferase